MTANANGTMLTRTMSARSLCRTIAQSAMVPPAKPQDKPGTAPAAPISLQVGTRTIDAAASPAAHQPGRVLGQKRTRDRTGTREPRPRPEPAMYVPFT